MSWFREMLTVPLPDGRAPSEIPPLDATTFEAMARSFSQRPAARVALDARSPWCSVTDDVIHLPDPALVPAEGRGRATAVALAFLLHECEHLRLDRDVTLLAAAHGASPPSPSEAARRAAAWRLRWGWRFSSLWEVAADIRVDRRARSDFPWGVQLLRDADESDHWRDGDPALRLAAKGPFTQVRDAVLLVGRFVCGPERLPSPLREVLAEVPAFLPMLDAQADVAVIEHTAAVLGQLAELARRPAVDVRVRFARALFDDALQREPPPLRCGCGGALHERDPDPVRGPVRLWRPTGGEATSLPSYEVATRDNDRVRSFRPAERRALRPAFRALPRRLPSVVGRMLDEVLARAEGLGARRLVAAQESGAALDPAAWPRIATGSADGAVWLDARRARAPELAVLVLVDQSGSMRSAMGGTTRIAAARAFAAALHHTLGEVPHAVVGFTTRPRGEVDAGALDALAEAGVRFDRFARVHDALLHTVFKGFDGDDPAALAAIDAGAGLNYDAEALWFAAGMLSARPERHRLLVALSDGHPSHAADSAVGATAREALRATVRALERDGVHLLGVGMGSRAVCDYYRDAVVLT